VRNYAVSLGVTGDNFDNLFLAAPLEFKFNIPAKDLLVNIDITIVKDRFFY
jgi:hypothetical protein